jgi:hypothetical protein
VLAAVLTEGSEVLVVAVVLEGESNGGDVSAVVYYRYGWRI